VIPLFALALLAAPANLPSMQVAQHMNASVTHPVFVDVPKDDGGGLTLYNPKGEVIARCDKKDDSFTNCKMQPGVTLDDLMNAWVRAYMDVQKITN
jgi:hypothetical protein